MDIGDRIAAWREAKGLSRRDVADALDITYAAACHWEGVGGQRVKPSLDKLERFVNLLGITMERFYGRIPKRRAS